jgi:ABC-type sugar transport system substrate-binding protein
VLVLATVLAGCSKSSKAASTGGSSSTTIDLAAYNKIVSDGIAQSSSSKFPGPTEAFAAPKNKKLAIVVCSGTLEGCVIPANAAKTAAEALGWKVTMLDGKGSPDSQNGAIQTAVASGVDAIITSAVDPAQISAGLAAAHNKHIPIGSIAQFAKASPTGYAFDIGANWADQGKAVGAWMVKESAGKAVVLPMSDKEFASTVAFVDAAVAEIKTCSTCAVQATENFVVADVGAPLGQRVVNLLQAAPKVNMVIGAYDPAAAFMVPAIEQAGLGSKIKLAAIVGTAQNLGFIRDGKVQAADVAFDANYEGWAAVDQMARLLAGKPLVETANPSSEEYRYSENVPWALLTKDNLPPAGQSWKSQVDTEGGFKHLWGL